jgi:hypothetical protein
MESLVPDTSLRMMTLRLLAQIRLGGRRDIRAGACVDSDSAPVSAYLSLSLTFRNFRVGMNCGALDDAEIL